MKADKRLADEDIILSLRHIDKHFKQPSDFVDRLSRKLRGVAAAGTVKAVSDVNLDIRRGEVLGVVGESGCGKSTLGRVIAGIMPATNGDLAFQGQTLQQMSAAQKRDYQLRVQMIFQDPFASLNPRMRVLDIIGEAPQANGLISRREKVDYVCDLMQKVGLDPDYRFRYPHQFSGGQRQRIGIARALALKPSVIVCDEAVAALDVSIQAQVLNLFIELRQEFNLTYLFISHNLGVVSHISNRVAIMYLGRVVELADVDDIFSRPNHPYTQALLEELPRLDPTRRQFEPIKGELPSPLNPPSGCAFHPRCPHAMPRCLSERPALKSIPAASPTASIHLSACHLNDMSAQEAKAEHLKLESAN